MADMFSIDLPQVHARLKVSGALQSEALSELFGVEGNSYPGSALATVWEFSTAPEWIDLASHLEAILGLVRPHFQDFRRLIVDQSLDVELQLSVLMAGNEVPAGYLDAIRVAELAAMGASLDIHLRTSE
jgi:ABC-type protease/lipase transport system fused ATPase/permease subunit